MQRPAKAGGTTMASTSDDPIIPAPPPWRLKGTVYSFLTYTLSKRVADLASDKYFCILPWKHARTSQVGNSSVALAWFRLSGTQTPSRSGGNSLTLTCILLGVTDEQMSPWQRCGSSRFHIIYQPHKCSMPLYLNFLTS
jgi:hypothetical protein